MDFRLDGQVAVVTGGTRGIGRAITETFVEHGAKVVMNGRSEAKGKGALDEGKQANKAAVANYITTKAALNGFSKAVAFEYGPLGITCNAICPAAIETDIMRESGPEAAAAAGITYEQFLQNYAEESMIKRLNRVEEVAAMALLLASEYGSGITGAVLSVDGGSSPY